MKSKRSLPNQIRANKRASFVFASFLILLIVGIVTGLTFLATQKYYWVAAVATFVISVAYAIWAYYRGAKFILNFSRVRFPEGPSEEVLKNVVTETALAAGIRTPMVFVIDDRSPNSFATGRGPNEGTVVFTTGILDCLSREQIQAVAAHEIAHIANNDVEFMACVTMLAGLLPMIADWLRDFIWGDDPWKGDPMDILLQIIVFIALSIISAISWFFASLLRCAVSRKREYLADAAAAQITRNPEALAMALMKLSEFPQGMRGATNATAHLFIVNPRAGHEDKGFSLFRTHPRTLKRVGELRRLMGNYRQIIFAADP